MNMALSRLAASANLLLNPLGISLHRNRPIRDAVSQLVVKMAELDAGTLLDVGANFGQFAQSGRKSGFHGAIHSFEPLASVHAQLEVTAQSDAQWHVMPRMALGRDAGTTQINVSQNLASSSLLEVRDSSTDVAPESAFSGREVIRVERLDSVADPAWKGPIALKIDTQGFEMEVLGGATVTLERVGLVLLEMSLVPLYEGGTSFCQLYQFMESHDFRCIGLTQGFADLVRHELLQVDALFIKN